MSPTIHPSPAGAQMCADDSPIGAEPLGTTVLAAGFPGAFPRVFPPRDADEATRRAWLASTPWPEVAFAAAR